MLVWLSSFSYPKHIQHASLPIISHSSPPATTSTCSQLGTFPSLSKNNFDASHTAKFPEVFFVEAVPFVKLAVGIASSSAISAPGSAFSYFTSLPLLKVRRFDFIANVFVDGGFILIVVSSVVMIDHWGGLRIVSVSPLMIGWMMSRWYLALRNRPLLGICGSINRYRATKSTSPRMQYNNKTRIRVYLSKKKQHSPYNYSYLIFQHSKMLILLARAYAYLDQEHSDQK